MADYQVTIEMKNHTDCIHVVTREFFRIPATRVHIAFIPGQKKRLTILCTFRNVEEKFIDHFIEEIRDWTLTSFVSKRLDYTQEDIDASLADEN